MGLGFVCIYNILVHLYTLLKTYLFIIILFLKLFDYFVIFRYGRYNTVKQLLDSEKGSFIINETDGEGLTPLHIASQQGKLNTVYKSIIFYFTNTKKIIHFHRLNKRKNNFQFIDVLFVKYYLYVDIK